MAVLKAYFDDSGHPEDPTHSVLAIGGYVSEIEAWNLFEQRWQDALDAAGVPYFHLKEFSDPYGLYRDVKASPKKERAFIASLKEAIHTTVECCPMAIVKLRDLDAFNRRHATNLDAYAVGVYGCIFELRLNYKNEEIDLVFDRFDNSIHRVGLGMEYARSDSLAGDFKVDGLKHVLLGEKDSWRNVKPLQAADFVAGEVRRYMEDRSTWNISAEARRTPEAWKASYQAWQQDFETQFGRRPRKERGSFTVLRGDSILGPQATVWDEHNLEQAHERHPNGWAKPFGPPVRGYK